MTIHARPLATRAAEGLPRRRFTVADVVAMAEHGILDEDERLELIGGELVPMSPKGNRHELVKTQLLKRWYRAAPEGVELTPETTFRLSADTYLEPDVVIYARADGLEGLDGATALLVVELADSSLRYDVGRKAMLYAGFGVRELWVIDVVRLELRVFRRPSAEGYGETRLLAASGEAVPAVAAACFALRLADLDIEGSFTRAKPGNRET